MGRKRRREFGTGAIYTVAVKLDDVTYTFVKTVCEELQMPISTFIRRILRYVMYVDPEKLAELVKRTK